MGISVTSFLKNFFWALAIFLVFPVYGQSVTDTLFLYQQQPQTKIEKLRSTRGYEITKGAIPLFVASALATTIDERIKETRDFHLSTFQNKYDDYLQFVPMVTVFGMKVAGVDGRSSWGEMLTADVVSAATLAAVVNGMKYTIKRPRPDNSKRNSFPSGHTAVAFMSATMLYKEYGDLSPWVGIAAYGSASLVAVGRMMNNRHWMSDVLFGAGVGVISTEFGYFISDLIFRPEKKKLFYNRNYDYTRIPSFLEYSLAYSCLFPQRYVLNGQSIHAYKGLSAALSGAHFFDSGWGLGGSTTLMSANLSHNTGNIGTLLFLGGPEYSSCLCPRLFWTAKAHVGGGTLLFNQDIKKRGFAAQAGLSLLAQISPTTGLRLFTDYTYTTLSCEPVKKDLGFLSVGISACALF